MAIILNHINYIYGADTKQAIHALNDVSLKIEKGEFIGLIGHTGSGKSTLVQHLNGLLKATSGDYLYNGEDVYDKDFDMKGLRFKVGLVFQYPEHQLFEETVFKDVCYGPKNLGMNDMEAGIAAFEAMKMVGLSEAEYYVSPFELSGGQKRRVAIAGVLAMKPEVLILDEPTAGLDPKGREDILNLIKRLQVEEGITIVLVSHSMEDVANYVNRILVMHKGNLIMDDIPLNVFKRSEELEAVGLSAPAVTYIMNDIKASGINVATSATTIAEAKEEILKALRK